MTPSDLSNGLKTLAEKGLGFTGVGQAAGDSQRLARECLDSLTIEFRLLDAVEASTRTELFGQIFDTPVMVAALSSLDRARPDGMAETARGASAAGAAMWVGVGDDGELGRVAGTGAKTVKIIKPYRDRDLVFEKIRQAEALGVMAIGMDISFSFGMKNGYAPAPMAPKTTADLERFIGATRLPFIVKGVLSRRDAEKAARAGAAGLVVSHQGGTVSDFATPPLQVLPEVVKEIGNGVPVFLECAVASGMDAFKAIALGAKGVCVGHKVAAGLAAGGAEGVRGVLDTMTAELKRAMSLTGAADLSSIDPGALRGGNPWR